MSTSEISPCQNVPQDLEMGNNNGLITYASIKKHKESILDIEESLEPQSECCIYRVPKLLRKMNEKAYTPQVISIGPLHHSNKELRAMEKQKIRFAREFGNRIKEETWQKFIDFIGENEKRIRKCYAEMPKKKFGKEKFIEMILYDAVFIIQFLLRIRGRNLTEFSMSNIRRVKASIRMDLLLLENQLPYFVLKELYKLAFSEHRDVYTPFFSLAFPFVCFDMLHRMSPEVKSKLYDLSEKEVIKHFTDLRRYAMIGDQDVELQCWKIGDDRDLPCAVKLQESGVKFKRLERPKCLLDLRVQKKKLLRIPIPCLNCPALPIPNIKICDETECFFRNLMALEQCHYPDQTHICHYIGVMDNLINTEADVNLLAEAGIISNFVGDTDRIAKMFNKLGLHITLSKSCYYVEDIKYLIKYNKSSWNQAKGTLKRVYFSNPWRGTGTVAAIVLLILTLIQTICSVKPFV